VNGTTAQLGEAVWRMLEPAIWLALTGRGVQSMLVRKSKWDDGGVESSVNGKADSSNVTWREMMTRFVAKSRQR
jgi:hypothetical protein